MSHLPLELSNQRSNSLVEKVLEVGPFVGLAYGFSWLCFLAYVVPNWGNLQIEAAIPYLMLGQFGPTIAALVMTGRTEGRAGVKKLLQRLLIFRFPWRWWFVTGWLLGLTLLAVIFPVALISDPAQTWVWLSDKWLIGLLPLVGLISAIFGVGPLGEELGWRGYLQPRFNEYFTPEVGSIVLGLIWAFWHLPLFFIADWRAGLSFPLFVLLYPISTIIISYGMYFLWKNTAGSVFVAILFHGILNAAVSNLMPDFVDPILMYLTVIGGFALWAFLARAVRPTNPAT